MVSTPENNLVKEKYQKYNTVADSGPSGTQGQKSKVVHTTQQKYQDAEVSI